MNSPIPQSIVNQENTRLLSICWEDGTQSEFSHGLLRSRCKCAFCQKQFRVHGAYPDTDNSIRITLINPISDTGLNLVFSDGHGRGIYPWTYLQQISAETNA
jgi:DUF971 family protein